MILLIYCILSKMLYCFNRLCAIWLKGYQRGSLGRVNKQCEKAVFPQESNLQSLDYRSTALPLELVKTSPLMLNFEY